MYECLWRPSCAHKVKLRRSTLRKCSILVHFLDHTIQKMHHISAYVMEIRDPTAESYENLLKAYEYFNGALFNGQLPSVMLTFSRQNKVMGYASIGRWVNNQRQYVDELSINPEYFAKYHLMEICQTLCHEMIHIWQAHFGTPGRRGYHNIQWARKMTEIGLIPSSTGKPGGDQTGEYMMDYVLYEGRFHKSCRTFLDTGYSIPWVDRYPIYRLDLPILAYDDRGAAVILNEKLNEKSPSSAAPFAAMKTDQISTTTQSRLEALPSLAVSFPDDVFSFDDRLSELISKPRPRSGRIKYTCKSCLIQLWGKPGLHVKCGDCDRTLIEVI